jgi:hypothetical protein
MLAESARWRRPRAWSLVSLVTLGLLACEPTVRLPPLPALADPAAPRGALLVVEGPGGVAAHAVAVDGALEAALPAILAPPGATLHVLAFACPLDCVGLPGGPVDLLDAPASFAPPLPAVAATFSLPPGDPRWREDVASPALRAALARLPLAAPDCPSPGEERPVAGGPVAAVGLADGALLTWTAGGVAVRVGAGGAPEPVPALAGARVLAAHRRGEAVEVLTASGSLLRLGPSGALEATLDGWPGPPPTRAWLDGPPDGPPLAGLFALDDAGVLRRSGDAGWGALPGCALSPTGGALDQAGLAWLGGARALAAGDARAVETPCAAALVRSPGEPAFTAVARVDGTGALVGDARGEVLRFTGLGLEPWAPAPSDGLGVEAIVPAGDGVLVARAGGGDGWVERRRRDGAPVCRWRVAGLRGLAADIAPGAPAAWLAAGGVTAVVERSPGSRCRCAVD